MRLGWFKRIEVLREWLKVGWRGWNVFLIHKVLLHFGLVLNELQV